MASETEKQKNPPSRTPQPALSNLFCLSSPPLKTLFYFAATFVYKYQSALSPIDIYLANLVKRPRE
jgi:hypothetical protein